MQKIIFIITLLAVAACSSTPPPPPEPKGEFIPVNPNVVKLSLLKI